MCIERLIHPDVFLRRFNWFSHYITFLQQYLRSASFWQGISGYIIICTPIIALIALIYYGIAAAFYEEIQFLLAALILIYCFGPGDHRRQLQSYIAAYQTGDSANVTDYMQVLLASTIPSMKEQKERAITESAIVKFNTQIFTVLFWFIILGPLGAILYRITTVIENCMALHEGTASKINTSAKLIRMILEWLPLRVLGFLFAFVGNFTQTFAFAIRKSISGLNYNQDFIVTAGILAIGERPTDPTTASIEENKAILALFDRVLIIWLAAIGLIILSVWVI